MGVLDENSLNSCKLNCSLSLVDLIHASILFLGLIYWVMRYLMTLSFWGEDTWKFAIFRIEKRRTKVGKPV